MFPFLAPPEVGPFLVAVEGLARMTAGGAEVLVDESVATRGDFGRAVAFALLFVAERNGEAVRGALEGVPVLEGGLLGRLIVGLSQEEKKSSPLGSPTGVEVPSAAAVSESSVMTTSSGYLLDTSACSPVLRSAGPTALHLLRPDVSVRPCTCWLRSMCT